MYRLKSKLSALLAALSLIFIPVVACLNVGQVAAAGPQIPLTIVAAEPDCSAPVLNKDNCKIVGYIVLLIRALSAIVGIVVVAMIIVGGIQYSASGDDPQAVASAKKRIINALLAIVVYVFGMAFLQYLVPGGIL